MNLFYYVNLNLSQQGKDKIKEHQRKKYQELIQCKKEALKNNFLLFP